MVKTNTELRQTVSKQEQTIQDLKHKLAENKRKMDYLQLSKKSLDVKVLKSEVCENLFRNYMHSFILIQLIGQTISKSHFILIIVFGSSTSTDTTKQSDLFWYLSKTLDSIMFIFACFKCTFSETFIVNGIVFFIIVLSSFSKQSHSCYVVSNTCTVISNLGYWGPVSKHYVEWPLLNDLDCSYSFEVFLVYWNICYNMIILKGFSTESLFTMSGKTICIPLKAMQM